MKGLAKHVDFHAGGIISLWLGNFRSELELDDYLSLSKQFQADFGFEIDPRDGPEAKVSEDGPMDIRRLLDGLSCSGTFIDAAAEGAETQGWTKATTALVFYNFKYDPAFINPDSDRPLTFIGSYSGGFG